MPIKYYDAQKSKKQVDQLAAECESSTLSPIRLLRRRRGSKAKRTIARIHGLGKLWQGVLNMPPAYTIEVVSEIYDKIPRRPRKTLVHELMHIPAASAEASDPTKAT
jgi:predicted metallopeptidase